MFVEGRSNDSGNIEEMVVYRHCNSFSTKDVSPAELLDFLAVANLDTNCRRSTANPKILKEQTMEVRQYEAALSSNIEAIGYRDTAPTVKAKIILDVIKSKDMTEDSFMLALARFPFDGNSALELNRTQCAQDCRGDLCWQCSAKNSTKNPSTARCLGENDARLVALNSCGSAHCQITCTDVATEKILGVKTPAGPNAGGPAAIPGSNGGACNPETSSECQSCRCWNGGLAFEPAKSFLSAAVAANQLKCSGHLYCERLFSEAIYRAADIAYARKDLESLTRVAENTLGKKQQLSVFSLGPPTYNPYSLAFWQWAQGTEPDSFWNRGQAVDYERSSFSFSRKLEERYELQRTKLMALEGADRTYRGTKDVFRIDSPGVGAFFDQNGKFLSLPVSETEGDVALYKRGEELFGEGYDRRQGGVNVDVLIQTGGGRVD